jgi:TonB family protein
MRINLLFAALVLFSVCTFGQSGKADENFNKGTQAYKAGNYKEAVSFFTVSIKESPTSSYYLSRALAFFQLGDSCNFCNDVKTGSNLGNKEAKNQYSQYCINTLVNNNIPDSIKLKYKFADHLETTSEICSSDSTTVVISKKDGETWSDDITRLGQGVVYTLVDVMPEFIGGEAARNNFLANNIIYPKEARDKSIEGTVYISFIVDRDGSVTNVKLLKGIGGGCDEESIRVVKMLPKWIPGTLNGKPVRVLFNMPIYFKLSGRKRF